jgi:hypothetical protein
MWKEQRDGGFEPFAARLFGGQPDGFEHCFLLLSIAPSRPASLGLASGYRQPSAEHFEGVFSLVSAQFADFVQQPYSRFPSASLGVSLFHLFENFSAALVTYF